MDLEKQASKALLRLRTPLGTTLVVVAILLLAFALRLYRLADSNIWWDEGRNVWLARQDLWSITLHTATGTHPLLHFFLLHFWDAIVGESAFAVRFSSLVSGILTVALLYRMGRSMVNGWLGLLAALLLAISRFHIWWSQEIKMYSLASLLSLLSLYLFLRLLRDGDWRLWLSFVLVSGLALWTHYLTVLILLAENGTMLVLLFQRAKRGDFRPPLIRWTVAQIGLILLFAPWLYLAITRPTTWSSPPPFHFPLFVHMAATVLSLGVTVEIERYLWPTLGFVTLVVVGLVSLFKGSRRERQGSLLLALTLLLPPLVIYLLSLPLATSFYAAKIAARYLLIFLPAYLLLLAWGIYLLGRRSWLLGLLASSFVLGSLAYTLQDYYAGRYLKDDYATLVGYIKSYWREGDGVILDTDFSWPIFLYYYKEGPWYGIPNALEMTAEEAEYLLSPILAQHPGVWLLMSPDSLVQDPQGLIPAWLGSHAREVVDLKYGDKRLLLYSQEPRDLCVIPPENLEIQHPLSKELAPGLWLEGYDPLREVRTGDLLRVVSFWRSSSMVHQITAGLMSASGETVKEVTLPLEAGCPEGEWRQGVIRLQHDLVITSEIPSGRYTLVLGVEGGERLTLTDIGLTRTGAGVVEAEPHYPMTLLLGEKVRFKGFDLDRTIYAPGEVMSLILYWEAASEMEISYVVFTHLLGQSYNPQRGNFIWGQVDSVPLGGSYPTTGWSVGERVRDEYRIPIEADAPAGEYELEIGMYEPVTGERLLVYSQEGTLLGDRILLGQIKVGE